MKNLLIFSTLYIATFFFTSQSLAQNYWIGGTLGYETNWNTAKNWSQNHVPDNSENVIIPDVSAQSGFFPVISQVIEPIPHIEIQNHAVLTILPWGRLVIDGKSKFKSGIFLNGDLVAMGKLDIANVSRMEIEQHNGKLFLRKGAWAGH
jgi:hypothetical protein